MGASRCLGVGVGLRHALFDATLATERRLDWLEVISEGFLTQGGRARWVLEQARARWPIVPHGVSLDVGGLDPLDEGYLERLAELTQRVDAPFFSDHLCFSRHRGVYLHDLLPLPFSPEAAAHAAARIRAAAARVGRPFLLENPSYYAVMPGSTLDEASFLRRVLEEADCGLLLDVNNVWVNAHNHGYDPRAFIEALPLERVGQIHLAGHRREHTALIDDHGGPVPDPVWALYRFTLERTGPISTLVEWDQRIVGLDPLLDEADRARAILQEHGG